MKKMIAIMLCVFMMAGCAKDVRVHGEMAKSYGLFNKERRNPNANYSLSAGSILVAIIFSETVIIPIYVFGWNLYEADRE